MNRSWRTSQPEIASDFLVIDGEQVISLAENQAQTALAEALLETSPGRLLEIGYGLGLAHSALRTARPIEHWVIEGNRSLASRCILAAEEEGDCELPIVVFDTWEHALKFLPSQHFDSILFDPYPFESDARVLGSWAAKFNYVASRGATDLGRVLSIGGRLGFLNFQPEVINVQALPTLFNGILTIENILTTSQSLNGEGGIGSVEVWILRRIDR